MLFRSAGGVNKVVDVSVSPNDHGSVDWTKRTTTYTEKTETATGGTEGTTVDVEVHRNSPSASSDAGGVNKVVDLSVSPNDHGSIDWTNANANRNSIEADQMWFWDADGQNYVNYYYMTDRKNTYYRWENDGGVYDGLVIPAYEGFFYNYKGEGTGFTLTLKNPLSNVGN